MKSLKVLHLSHNLLRGSMPEGLVSRLGANKVHDFVMPGNRLADVDTVRLQRPVPLHAVLAHVRACCVCCTSAPPPRAALRPLWGGMHIRIQ